MELVRGLGGNLRELGVFNLGKRRLRREGPSRLPQLPDRRAQPGGALLPGNKGQDKMKWPQAATREVQVGHFLRRNFLTERVNKHWKGLLREVWSHHPWRCPKNSALWSTPW